MGESATPLARSATRRLRILWPSPGLTPTAVPHTPHRPDPSPRGALSISELEAAALRATLKPRPSPPPPARHAEHPYAPNQKADGTQPSISGRDAAR